MRRLAKYRIWIAWAVVTAALCAWGVSSFKGDRRRVLLPGKTTHGHYQIELACESCHTEPFATANDIQKACVTCHGEELKEALDAHPKSKFTDPRNADRLAQLDARYCVTCHLEHRPEATHTMGLTLPVDYCFRCHEDIAEDRPSHQGLGFETCASAGCHNFHDNRALYEDFLVQHAGERAHLLVAHVPPRTVRARIGAHPDVRADAPDGWTISAHFASGKTCSDCHGAPSEADPRWSTTVSVDTCGGCHEHEKVGFTSGRHGMRIAAGLSPMRPRDARLSMKRDASHLELTCTSCHSAHAFDTRFAAAEACVGCHNDEHTNAYQGTKHEKLWSDELAHTSASGTGVSCATCHLPRSTNGGVVRVQHNQNDGLRPNEKMIRPVCMNCHGLEFSINALADEALVRANFDRIPITHVESMTMATSRRDQKEKDNNP